MDGLSAFKHLRTTRTKWGYGNGTSRLEFVVSLMNKPSDGGARFAEQRSLAHTGPTARTVTGGEVLCRIEQPSSPYLVGEQTVRGSVSYRDGTQRGTSSRYSVTSQTITCTIRRNKKSGPNQPGRDQTWRLIKIVTVRLKLLRQRTQWIIRNTWQTIEANEISTLPTM